MKQCSICGIEKEMSDFYRSGKGYFSYCKPCAIKKNEEWKRNNPDKAARIWAKMMYGLSYEDYERLLIKYQSGCGICHKKVELAIDHDHKTGRVRGMLCRNCNHGLGKFFDSIDNLQSAIEYLRDL